ncbi:MAG TPA: carboxymuconolactone decarboxylase family protein [Thermoanaerobaculia bacterium]|nr:carboxymuconolactone decarboxylase family protein [Thermoanaerobaculia bacterium]HUM29389.1 carboxymuconolactone decarboxylase family protein [Thermoanaerobaculia bacterium]HXK67635.1 carboxymuconolactone decarboxylase family protein [Thermoanaerobaculia bacterium]
MGANRVRTFKEERERLNSIVLENAGLVTKRFFNLDTQTYQDGALPSRTKEMLGLVASTVLRCDDCILYHLIQCREQGLTREELEEILSVSLIVGGSITIPHIRRAWAAWEEMAEA